MATLFWTILALYPFVAHSQSGDDEELNDPDCWSLMNLSQSRIICVLNEDDLEIYETCAKLCPFSSHYNNSECINATMEDNRFTFQHVIPVLKYTLHLDLREGQHQTKTFHVKEIVKIPTPQIENATYKLDEAVIHLRYMHDYVKHPEFQVEFWENHSSNKEKMKVNYQPIRIGGDKLRDNDVYKVRVRAKPVDFFNGSWTEWSTVKSFRVNHTRPNESSPVLYILLCLTPIVLVVIMFPILRWKKEIQAYIFPDVPNPKATLAQIHRQKEHLPVSFSPEIFKDINIYPVVYNEEKQFTTGFGEDKGDTTESYNDEVAALKRSCPTLINEKQYKDDQSLDLETSQMTVRLLDESASTEDVRNDPECQSVAALQRHSKDETYVTMSSLYKTQ
ncbi:interleukin-7 receptor subunit alpha [Clarias gariepinus]